MPNQTETIVARLFEKLPRVSDLNAAVEAVRMEFDSLSPGLSASLSAEIEAARGIVCKQLEDIEILVKHSVCHRRPQWFFGSKPSDLHWPALYGYLLNEKDWDEDDVRGIDDASNEVVSLLENPRDPQRTGFACRGLVVGHVQSGKTANMTAVMAKALDAGYDTVIVLAGLTNKLRYQTQMRFFNDLVTRNPLNWQVLTPNEVNRDFRAPPQGGFLSHSDKAQLAVIKKNVSPLRELKLAIKRTLPAVLRQLRILFIDDECDQASVNSARGETDMTAINGAIREILSMLPAVSYVGYTATPFANVLIDPYKIEGMELDDLYPRDFITALPEPGPYFGTRKLFGLIPADPENVKPEEEGIDMIRDVTIDEERALQPPGMRERDSFQPQMTSSLEDAIVYFLMACAARRARGQGDKHMTMLIHTSAYVNMHERVGKLVKDWVDSQNEAMLDPDSDLAGRMRRLWQTEGTRLPTDITNACAIAFDELYKHMPTVLDRVEFPIENGASDDRIVYENGPQTYIVVGGSILARGLTLEGLMVSYFLRTANQYDTLLQMGRWFGFRPGYEDLPRLWMPPELKHRFRALAAIEQEVREDIEQYRLRDLTPLDLAVRIRSIPGMAITGATKMRAARRCAIGYWGAHRQTFRFAHKDTKLLRHNWDSAAVLLQRAETLGLRDEIPDERKLWRGVPKSEVRTFLNAYRFDESHSDLASGMLMPFLDQSDPRLSSWNIGVVEATRGLPAERDLGPIGPPRTVQRARLRDSGPVADIKALMSRQDVLFDCPDLTVGDRDWVTLKEMRASVIGQVPLLLLYPIGRNSPAKSGSKVREALDAAHDVLGVAIVFPGSVTEGGSYVSVELRMLSTEDVEEIEAEEAAQSEAAGVV